jgi:hypothetical protein
MRDFDEQNITDAVIDRLKNAPRSSPENHHD